MYLFKIENKKIPSRNKSGREKFPRYHPNSDICRHSLTDNGVSVPNYLQRCVDSVCSKGKGVRHLNILLSAVAELSVIHNRSVANFIMAFKLPYIITYIFLLFNSFFEKI